MWFTEILLNLEVMLSTVVFALAEKVAMLGTRVTVDANIKQSMKDGHLSLALC